MVDVYILHDDDGVIKGVGHVLPAGVGRVKAVATTGRHLVNVSMDEAELPQLKHLHITHQINRKTGLLVSKAHK
jgi:hypothetical protein